MKPFKHVVPFNPIVCQTPKENWNKLGLDITGGEIISVKDKGFFEIKSKISGQYVHAQGRGFPFPELSAFFAKKAVYTPHNDILGSRRWTRFARRIIFNRYDKIICQTEYGKKMFIKQGIKPEKIVVLPIPVDYGFFSKPRGGEDFRKKYKLGKETFVLSVGIRPVKNPDIIVKACKEAGVKCVLVGPYTKEEVRKTWKQEGFDWYLPSLEALKGDNVILTGQLSANQYLGALDAATVFVNSSVYESFGLAVYEAASAGKALCLPDYGSFVVFKDCALFHQARDANQLAKNIKTYLDNTKLRKSNGVKAKQIAKGFDYPIVRKKFERFYNEFSKD